MDTITKEEIDEFLTRWEQGEFRGQRLGQAFCNALLDGSASFPELFFEQNNGVALRRIIYMKESAIDEGRGV